MPEAPRERFLLFAASEPDAGPDPFDAVVPMGRRMLGLALPTSLVRPPASAPSEGRSFPDEQSRAVRLALDVAESLGRPVRLVDLAGSPEDRALAAQYVSEEPILPILVAPSGRRLEGLGEFVPSRLRRFFRSD